MIYVSLILVAIAGTCKAVMDTLKFHFYDSVFIERDIQFWNTEVSWKNKYKSDLKTPKFWGSTTIFVFKSDGWHLFQSIFLTSLFTAMIFYVLFKLIEINYLNLIINFIIMRSVFGLFFVLFYNYLLIKK